MHEHNRVSLWTWWTVVDNNDTVDINHSVNVADIRPVAMNVSSTPPPQVTCCVTCPPSELTPEESRQQGPSASCSSPCHTEDKSFILRPSSALVLRFSFHHGGGCECWGGQ